jgi:hypothetical protein
MNSKITYKQLRDELENQGWKAKPIEIENFGVNRESMVFQNPKTDLYIILPRMKPTTIVERIHLLHVRNVLENAGFWDSLIRQTESENHQEATLVLQTLSGIKNGKRMRHRSNSKDLNHQ